jgi:hypothetical protein
MIETVALPTGNTHGSLYWSMRRPLVPTTGMPASLMRPERIASESPSDEGTTGRANIPSSMNRLM